MFRVSHRQRLQSIKNRFSFKYLKRYSVFQALVLELPEVLLAVRGAYVYDAS